MTSLQEVSLTLADIDNQVTNEWLHNDIIKAKLAKSYDDWLTDIDDHQCFLTLEEHIHVFLDHYNYFGDKVFRW